MKPHILAAAMALALATTACNGGAHQDAAAAPGGAEDAAASTTATTGNPFDTDVIAVFDEPGAMSCLPDGQLLVTEKKGRLKLVDVESGRTRDVSGVPRVDYGGQGGFGDVLPHPGFADNGIVYL